LKALLQRVTKASVKVDHNITGKIDNGLVVLLGVAVGDTYHDAEYLARKVSELRIFTDSEGKFNLSVKDVTEASWQFRSLRCWPIHGKAEDPALRRLPNLMRQKSSLIILSKN